MFKKIENIIILVLAAGIVVFGYLYFTGQSPAQKEIVSAEEAGRIAVGFINEFVIEGAEKAELISDVTEEKGLYKVNMKVGDQDFSSYVTKDGAVLFPQQASINMQEVKSAAQEAIAQGNTTPENGIPENSSETLSGFLITQDEVCIEDSKPIVYFFGADWCPHCQWEHPVVEGVAEKFTGFISFHNNMNETEKDQDVFSKYSPEGSVPLVVLGCVYYRLGSGESLGEEIETNNLTALICDLTNNQPAELCAGVEPQ